MKLSAKGLTFIKEHEGWNPKVYADSVGYPTIGYGTLLTLKRKYNANKDLSAADASKELKAAGVSYTQPITVAQGVTLLKNELSDTEKIVNKLSQCSRLSQNQYDSIVSFTFNAGNQFGDDDWVILLDKDTIFPDFVGPITAAELKKLNTIVTKAFTYTKADGRKSQGLVNRRNDEATLFCKGRSYTYTKIV